MGWLDRQFFGELNCFWAVSAVTIDFIVFYFSSAVSSKFSINTNLSHNNDRKCSSFLKIEPNIQTMILGLKHNLVVHHIVEFSTETHHSAQFHHLFFVFNLKLKKKKTQKTFIPFIVFYLWVMVWNPVSRWITKLCGEFLWNLYRTLNNVRSAQERVFICNNAMSLMSPFCFYKRQEFEEHFSSCSVKQCDSSVELMFVQSVRSGH